MLLFVETFLLVLCAAIAAVGYGSGLSPILRIESNLGDRGILGLLSFGFLGCLLHFVIPLTPAVHLAILAGGVSVAVVDENWPSKSNSRMGRGRDYFYLCSIASTVLSQL